MDPSIHDDECFLSFSIGKIRQDFQEIELCFWDGTFLKRVLILLRPGLKDGMSWRIKGKTLQKEMIKIHDFPRKVSKIAIGYEENFVLVLRGHIPISDFP